MLIIYSVVSAQNTATLDPSQVYNTGNLVNNSTSPTSTTGTWQNIGLWNQGLPCWQPGDPGCGPLPYFNNGSLNYSYGTADVRQTVNINAALSSIGSGLRVNGYNFGFTAKNGNGWDNGMTDQLSAYVRFVDPSNKSVFDKSYNLNYQFNWTTFNFNETFTTPFATKDLGAVTYGIIGRDNNGWAGPYGPEVYGINFSLKYSVDPCAKDVLSSPTCPGYLDALAKLAPANTVTPTISATTTVTDPVTVTATSTPTTSTSTQVTAVAAVVSAPAPTSSSTTTSSQSSKESSTSNTSMALSIISKNSERDSAALSVAQTATSQASAAAQQSQQEAASIAASAVSNSQAVNIVSIGGQQSSGNGIKANTSSSNLLSAMSNNSLSGLGNSNIATLGQPVQTSTVVSPNITTIATEQLPTTQTTVLPNNNTASSNVQSYAILPPNFLTDRTNPLTEIVEGRQIISPSTTVITTGPSVNTNAGDNDAAGGVSISKIATAPKGYGDYLNFTLRDVAFYAPKEVYRNQKNVDNARALRQLTNDYKHQEMVNSQYKAGN